MFVVLPSIRPRNIVTIIDHAQVFTSSKPNQTSKSYRKLGAEAKYLRLKRSMGGRVFVVLPPIRPRYIDTVIERSHVLLFYSLKARKKHSPLTGNLTQIIRNLPFGRSRRWGRIPARNAQIAGNYCGIRLIPSLRPPPPFCTSLRKRGSAFFPPDCVLLSAVSSAPLYVIN